MVSVSAAALETEGVGSPPSIAHAPKQPSTKAYAADVTEKRIKTQTTINPTLGTAHSCQEKVPCDTVHSTNAKK